MKNIFLPLLQFIFSVSISAQTPLFIKDSLDSYITQGMKDWQVPGLSIVIVKDGKIICLKGYGVKDIPSKEPVSENTLFMIASNTKLFTATCLAQMEYYKKISLDDKFTKYFPDYSLYEPTTTELLTIRDLLCHRIGTETYEGDFTFWNGKLSSSEIMQKMKLLKPVGLFRQNYGYCNSCFLSAAQVIPKVTGREWKDYVKDSILFPLQMNSTYTSIKNIPNNISLAKPYTTSFTGTLKEVPFDQWDNLGPAAAIISNVSDLSHWLLFQLDSGKFNGKEIMPFEILQNTRDINLIISSRKSSSVPTHIVGYALGVQVADYNGYQVYWHTGGASGMVSNVCFVPEKKLGIAILTNNDNQNFYGALRQQILDAFLGVSYHNRSKAYLIEFEKNLRDSLKVIEGWKLRVKNNLTPHPLVAYTGHYLNPLYGSMDINLKSNRLFIKFNGHDNLTATLDYMDNGDWLLRYENIEYGIFSVRFKTDNDKVISIDTKENDFVELEPYTFTKE